MATINPQASEKLQFELMSGETIYWAGMPTPNVIFHSDDWTTIPFTLVWTGFWVFWEASALGYWRGNSRATGPETFSVLWGIPFLILGNYMVWGRFLVDAWAKRRTYYALTNRRVLIVQEGWNRRRTICSKYLEFVPSIEREGERIGTLWFGPKYPLLGGRSQRKRSMSRFDVGDVPVFADIDDVDSVYRLALELKETARKSQQKRDIPLFSSILDNK